MRVALFLFVFLVQAGQLAAQPAASASQNPAESLRRYLAGKGAMSPPNWWTFAEDLTKLYSTRSIEKPPGCPLTSFKDQPSTASNQSLNTFVVDFKQPAETVCRDAPNPGVCQSVRDSCLTVGTSIFCDFAYLNRLETVGKLAYHAAWKGLEDVQAGKTAMFIPLPQPALIDLSRITLAQRSLMPPPVDLSAVPEAERFSRAAESGVSELATSMALLIPVLHEVAHVEQAFCGRSIGKEGSDDFVARMMFTGERNYAETSKAYEELTCSSLSRNELDADLVSIDMFYRYLEDEATAVALNPRFKFDPALDEPTRRKLTGIARFSREIALLSVMHTLEYQLLVQDDPQRALTTAQSEPVAGTSLQGYSSHYISAGSRNDIQRVRGHLEPAYRAITMTRALGMDRLKVANLGQTVAITHLRVAPFAIGRFISIRELNCGTRVTDRYLDGVTRYVLDAFTGSMTFPSQGPGDAREAAKLVYRFVTSPSLRRALTISLRPTLADYRTIFEQPFADKAYRYYEPFWNSDEGEITLNPDSTDVHVYPLRTDDVRQDGGARHLPGGYRQVARFLRPGLTIYAWRFVRPGGRFGQAYDGLYYVNGRWVFVPKPYRVE